MASICLCMIVKNEEAVIERCIESVRGVIDSWVICDTGSTDRTPQIIERVLADVPGTLHHREWRDFGHNRTELMQLARGLGEYQLLIDADMTVSYEHLALERLRADSYLLRHDEPVEYWIKRLVRSELPWRYVGATHEYLTCDVPEVSERSDAIVIHHHADGGTRHEKYERDLALLLAEKEADPTNSRTIFYLAQTCRELGRSDEAIQHYEQRASMGGWEEEVFYSKFQVGVLRAEAGAWGQALLDLIAAWEYRPTRLEPLYELASRLRVRREYQSAHLFAKRGVFEPKPKDSLFVSRWVYQWGLLFEYSITSYWVGDAKTALSACRKLLALAELPDDYRRQTERNMEYCQRQLADDRRMNSPRRDPGPTAKRGRRKRR